MRIIKYLVLLFIVTVAVVTSYLPSMDLTQRQNRFLLCMSSFKRPIFASGQIFRLMNQTYQNFDISLSLKGVDEAWSRLTFEKEWQDLKKEKRLFVRYDENRGQLHNLLDTVRNIDLNKYDYFCKIDDDDWYAPTYLQTVNNALNKADGIDITHTTNTYILTEDISSTHFSGNFSNLSGPTMCFSRKIIQIALDIEKDPNLLQKYLPGEADPRLFTTSEDRILHHTAQNIGKEQFRTDTEPQVIFGWQYRSVMRNDNYVKY